MAFGHLASLIASHKVCFADNARGSERSTTLFVAFNC
jgi:hypothetical protein